jgi:hypothetical protein
MRYFEITIEGTNVIEHSPKVFENYRCRDRFPGSISEFIALGRARNGRAGLVDVEGPKI